ncbi:hypothetical protein BH10BAC3_BH10BAC3_11310 [soil metagenome]
MVFYYKSNEHTKICFYRITFLPQTGVVGDTYPSGMFFEYIRMHNQIQNSFWLMH